MQHTALSCDSGPVLAVMIPYIDGASRTCCICLSRHFKRNVILCSQSLEARPYEVRMNRPQNNATRNSMVWGDRSKDDFNMLAQLQKVRCTVSAVGHAQWLPRLHFCVCKDLPACVLGVCVCVCVSHVTCEYPSIAFAGVSFFLHRSRINSSLCSPRCFSRSFPKMEHWLSNCLEQHSQTPCLAFASQIEVESELQSLRARLENMTEKYNRAAAARDKVDRAPTQEARVRSLL